MTSITVNGRSHRLDLPPEIPLLWVLRDHLGLTGTKYGCGRGLCGACTVHLDGAATRSCMVTLGSVGGRAVTTIEGLSADGGHPVQRAWIEEDVPQCGYCQTGQVMTVAALLARKPDADAEEIAAALWGNLCRCGTYPRILAAARRAAVSARENGR